MITEAHLHLRKTKSEVRARTYQIHVIRCTSRHRYREDHTLPRRNRQRMKKTTRRRKIEIKIEKNHKSKREERAKKVQFRQESKKSRKETVLYTSPPIGGFDRRLGCRCLMISRGVCPIRTFAPSKKRETSTFSRA